MRRALLIVDVQNDFTEGGALGVEGGTAVSHGITELLQTSDYDLVIASRDWHDSDSLNGGHFADAGEEPDYVSTWPHHCVAGTDGADYHSALNIDLIDVHIRKGMGIPAYSAFEGETVDGKDLSEVLNEHEIGQLDVVGIATDYCVRASALDAAQHGLSVRVLSDFIAGVAPQSAATALKELAATGIQIR